MPRWQRSLDCVRSLEDAIALLVDDLFGLRDRERNCVVHARVRFGANEPMLWTIDYGKGRVFVTALGHDGEVVQTPAFTTTYARGAEWAATGKVTLPIPPAMAK